MSIQLTRVKISNFRGVVSGDLQLSRVNCFVSENGVGKTSCLAAIARLFPILRGERRIFLDADFRIRSDHAAESIEILYEFRYFQDGDTYRNLSLTVRADRRNQGDTKSHFNAQDVPNYECQITGPEESWAQLTGERVAKGKQKVIRNGWSGNRICPIDLSREPLDRHAATSFLEEGGAADGFRARMVAKLEGAPQKEVVDSHFPELENSIVKYYNSTVSSEPISIFRSVNGQLVIVKEGGLTTPFNCLSGGEIAAINLAMSHEYIVTGAPCDFIFLEEPESCFHPNAQSKIVDALLAEFDKQQIFISTHSPFVYERLPSESEIIIATEADGSLVWKNLAKSSFLYGQVSVSELSYLAYGHPTFDYLNQIYGYIQMKEGKGSLIEMDKYLVGKGIPQTKRWQRDNGASRQVTLATYIRNFGHHPENCLNPKYSPHDLENAIEDLRALL